jgi:hypothetical protein
MKKHLALVSIMSLGFLARAQGQASAPLKPLQKIPLPNVKGRLDHFGADLPGRWLFVAALGDDQNTVEVVTRRPPFVVVLNTDTGKEVARVPVGGSCDDVYYDAQRNRIYALGGEGFGSVVQQNDPDHYALSANIPTTVGVPTGIFYGTSLQVGVPAAGLEPGQIWNYGVPE